jgi:glycosyltransferase involved in cell wall biosynthesis
MIPIFHVRSTNGFYGAERALLTLASATREPFVPIVGALIRSEPGERLVREARALGLLAQPMADRSRMDLAAVAEIARAAHAAGAACLHAHDYKSLALCALAGLAARMPVVATFHGDTGGSLRVKTYETFGRFLANATQVAAAASRALAASLRAFAPCSPIVHIPNGLQRTAPANLKERAAARVAFGIPPDASAVAVIGRLSPEKGHGVLLRALLSLSPCPTVLVAGDGPLREWILRFAKVLPLRILGYCEKPRPVYAAADVIVLPSLTEGLPLVALEAMALGRCVVASAVGDLPEVLGGGAGLLIPPGDVGALARALGSLLASPARRETLAEVALERVRSCYSAEAMAAAYARSVYACALDGPFPRHDAGSER